MGVLQLAGKDLLVDEQFAQRAIASMASSSLDDVARASSRT
jgi:hypothetical protein